MQSSKAHPLHHPLDCGGFVAEDYEDDSPNYFARASLDVKNLSTLENLPEPLVTPPSYEESETSAGIDESVTPHHITVRSLSVSEPLPIPKHPHVWQIKRTTITLSALEATVLVKSGILEYKDLRLFVFLFRISILNLTPTDTNPPKTSTTKAQPIL